MVLIAGIRAKTTQAFPKSLRATEQDRTQETAAIPFPPMLVFSEFGLVNNERGASSVVFASEAGGC